MSWRASDNEPGPHDVVRIEYDPNRSAHIALIKNQDPSVESLKKWSYILACEGLWAGHVMESLRQGIPHGLVEGFVDSKKIQGKVLWMTTMLSANATLALGLLRARTVKPGNVLTLCLMPPQSSIVVLNYRILLHSASSFGQVIVHEDNGRYTQVHLQSGDVRRSSVFAQSFSRPVSSISRTTCSGRESSHYLHLSHFYILLLVPFTAYYLLDLSSCDRCDRRNYNY